MVCLIVWSESEYQSNPLKRLETTTNLLSRDTHDRPLEPFQFHNRHFRSLELT